jgi:hypothetical protein
MDPFAALALDDLILGAEMDRLACRRILAAKKFRAGQHLSKKELRHLARDTQHTARQFERNWLKRNRPSRLRDNLKLFEHAARECESLAGKGV